MHIILLSPTLDLIAEIESTRLQISLINDLQSVL